MRIANYTVADRVLGRQNKVKLPGEETFLHELHSDDEHPDIALLYRNTNVLIYRANGDIVYNHGGWVTGTTAKRMAGYGPESVEIIYQREAFALRVDGQRYDFGDDFALVVHPDGKVEPYNGPVDCPTDCTCTRGGIRDGG